MRTFESKGGYGGEHKQRQCIFAHFAFLVSPFGGSSAPPDPYHHCRPRFSPEAQILQHKDNSQRLPPHRWTLQSEWLISPETGNTANATLSRNATTGRGPKDAHSSFIFQTGKQVSRVKWLAQGVRNQGFQNTLAYFSNFTSDCTTPANAFGRRGKRYIFASL